MARSLSSPSRCRPPYRSTSTCQLNVMLVGRVDDRLMSKVVAVISLTQKLTPSKLASGVTDTLVGDGVKSKPCVTVTLVLPDGTPVVLNDRVEVPSLSCRDIDPSITALDEQSTVFAAAKFLMELFFILTD